MRIKYESATEHRDEFPKVALPGSPKLTGKASFHQYLFEDRFAKKTGCAKNPKHCCGLFPIFPACCQGRLRHGSYPALLGLSRGRCLGWFRYSGSSLLCQSLEEIEVTKYLEGSPTQIHPEYFHWQWERLGGWKWPCPFFVGQLLFWFWWTPKKSWTRPRNVNSRPKSVFQRPDWMRPEGFRPSETVRSFFQNLFLFWAVRGCPRNWFPGGPENALSYSIPWLVHRDWHTELQCL